MLQADEQIGSSVMNPLMIPPVSKIAGAVNSLDFTERKVAARFFETIKKTGAAEAPTQENRAIQFCLTANLLYEEDGALVASDQLVAELGPFMFTREGIMTGISKIG